MQPIMVKFDEDRLDTLRIIDLGSSRAAQRKRFSTIGSFAGTPEYASRFIEAGSWFLKGLARFQRDSG
jgi:hypothetical protein